MFEEGINRLIDFFFAFLDPESRSMEFKESKSSPRIRGIDGFETKVSIFEGDNILDFSAPLHCIDSINHIQLNNYVFFSI